MMFIREFLCVCGECSFEIVCVYDDVRAVAVIVNETIKIGRASCRERV